MTSRTTCKHIWNAHRFCQWCGQDKELFELHAEIERLQAELVALREQMRPRRLTDELPPETMHEALFWDGVRWEMLNDWEGDGWAAEYAAGQLDDLIYWQPLPEPPQ